MKSVLLMLFALIATRVSDAQPTAPQQGVITYDLAIHLRENVARINPALAATLPEVVHTTLLLSFQGPVFALVAKGNIVSEQFTQTGTGAGTRKNIVNLRTFTRRKETRLQQHTYYTEQTIAAPRQIRYSTETKKILGYTCLKAIVTTAEQTQATVWYTTGIPYAYCPQTPVVRGLKGAVLQLDMGEQVFTATSVQAAGFDAAAITPDAKARKVTEEQLEDLAAAAAEDSHP